MKAMYQTRGQRGHGASASRASTGRPRRTPSTTASAAPASRARGPIDSQGGGTGNLATYERLRAAGNNGVQLPIKEYKDGKLIGTEMLYMDGKFDTADGKAEFKPSPWPGLPKTGRRPEGQAQVLDQQRPRQRGLADRLPRQVQRVRARPLADGVPRDQSRTTRSRWASASGDVVEVFNDFGSTYAMAYLEPSTKPGQTFMQFGYFNGIAGRRDHRLDRPQHHPLLQGNLGEHSAGRHGGGLQGDRVVQGAPLRVNRTLTQAGNNTVHSSSA